MDPEDFQRIQEAMPNIGTVRSFNVVEGAELSGDELIIYIEGDNGGFRFPMDAVRAEDMAAFFDDLADELAVES
ncbi:hypothetical protein [Saliphagus infecundisoli]|uniref:Uncharacterized protein n=1 Tax=Saliphagus infecundisoli TaxID=1849069 RepID=A0ABD5QI54_9EURY|nr:hypothetical protein [Saliphagus infecundisoli]